jgi:hypothetical protein
MYSLVRYCLAATAYRAPEGGITLPGDGDVRAP